MFADKFSSHAVGTCTCIWQPFYSLINIRLFTCTSSSIVYSVAPLEVVDPLVCDGFVDELVEVLEHRAGTVNVS